MFLGPDYCGDHYVAVSGHADPLAAARAQRQRTCRPEEALTARFAFFTEINQDRYQAIRSSQALCNEEFNNKR